MIKLFFVLLLVPYCVQAQIPADRRIEWKPGVRGGIPARTDLIDVKNAPYSAKGDGNSDDKSAIQKAIDAAKKDQVVYLPKGTYRISGALEIFDKSISLRGDGPDTVIKYDGAGGINIIKAYRWSGYGTPINITGGFDKGSTSLDLQSAGSVTVGTVVYIGQTNDPSFVTAGGDNGTCSWCGRNDPNRTMIQVDKVTAKNGNTVTLERPLYLGLDSSRKPQLVTMSTVSGIGIEDLKVWRSNKAAADGANIEMSDIQNSWIKGVTSQNPGNRHFRIMSAYACEVRECDLRSDDNWWNHGSDHGYGVFIFGVNSDHLVVDNIVYRCRHGLIFEGGGSGCVIAYNYSVGAVSEPDKDWLTGDLDTHGSHPFMNLFEGNTTSKIALDNTWGSASHNTGYRNNVLNFSKNNTTPTGGRWAIDVEANSYYNNFAGNVIGRQGDKGDQFAKTGISWTTLATYRLGFQCPGCGNISDPKVKETTLLNGNFDYISGDTVWSGSDHTLPPSLYLTARPDFWPASLRWPAIGPDLDPMVSANPAELRYNGEAPPTGTPAPTPKPSATPTPAPTPPTATPAPSPSSTPRPTPTPAAKFNVGDSVTTTGVTNIRATPAGLQLGTQAEGATGIIQAGPQAAVLNGENVIWYQVEFSKAPNGWAGDDNMELSAPRPTPTPCP